MNQNFLRASIKQHVYVYIFISLWVYLLFKHKEQNLKGIDIQNVKYVTWSKSIIWIMFTISKIKKKTLLNIQNFSSNTVIISTTTTTTATSTTTFTSSSSRY